MSQWKKFYNRKWKWCRYCGRTIFREPAYKLQGASAYIICKGCYGKEGIRIEQMSKEDLYKTGKPQDTRPILWNPIPV